MTMTKKKNHNDKDRFMSVILIFISFRCLRQTSVTNIEYMRKRVIDSSCCCLSVIFEYLVAPDGLYKYVSFKQDDFSSRHSTYSIEVYTDKATNMNKHTRPINTLNKL